MNPNDILAQIEQAAAVAPDMREAVKGGSGARLLPAGKCLCRLVSYVELGKHPQEFGGKAKDPANEIRVGFALFGKGYENEDGTPYIIRPFSFAVSHNEKSKAYKLFKALNYTGTKRHFAQLLGEAFLATIVHEPKSKADQTLVSRLDMNAFLPALDPLTGAPYQVPPYPVSECELFLWDAPTKAQWDALYIEGTWDDGRSKNVTQETILSALNFEGSPLHQLLMGGNLALPTAQQAPVQAPVAPASLPPGAGYAQMTPVAPTAPEVAAPPPFVPAAPAAVPAPAGFAAPLPVTPAPVIHQVPVQPVQPISPPTFPSSPALPQ